MTFGDRDIERLRRRLLLDEKRAENLSVARTLVFTGAALAALALGWAELPWFFQLPSTLGFVAFGVLVWRHDKLTRCMLLFRKRLEFAHKTRAIAALDWSQIPALPTPTQLDKLPRYFSDLDLLSGRAVLRLVNHTVSTAGFRALLSRFRSNGLPLPQILARQERVKEAQRLRVLRRRFFVLESLWAGLIESDRIEELLRRPLHTPAAPRFFLLVAALQAAFVGSFVYFATIGGRPLFLLLGLLLLLAYKRAAREIRLLEAYDYGMSLDVSLGKFAALSEVAGRMSKSAGPSLRTLLAPFEGERNPSAVLARTGRVVGYLGVRQNVLLHLALNLSVPWDFYWSLRLERLRREIQKSLPEWLLTLAELEVDLSLAEYQANLRGGCEPEFVEDAPYALRATDMAHPLLPPATRVGNDVEINPQQRCLLLTGSNMSGKSTFLRTLGVNFLLAKAGVRVCARHFSARPMDLATSIRLNDSLEEGLSAFYAEVRQLRYILDEAHAPNGLFYLIDEVFRGTNNRERLIGSQAFVRALSQTPACGLITTHDLELASLEAEAQGVRNLHFKETIEDGKMRFSHRLAPGPCPTTNALRVMELAGLPVR